MFDNRLESDYADRVEVEKQDIKEELARAEEFVSAITVLSHGFLKKPIDGPQSTHHVCHCNHSNKLFVLVSHRQTAYIHLIQHFHSSVEVTAR